MIRLRRKAERRADRLTLGLAVVAVGTAGTVIGTEVARLARRRSRAAAEPVTVLEGAEQALAAAGGGAQDTVAVAIEAYDVAACSGA